MTSSTMQTDGPALLAGQKWAAYPFGTLSSDQIRKMQSY